MAKYNEMGFIEELDDGEVFGDGNWVWDCGVYA